MRVKNGLLVLKSVKYSKIYIKDFDKGLVKRFSNTYRFCYGDIKKFRLMLRKGVYAYEYINSCQ